MTENSDLEKYAPRKWRPPENLSDATTNPATQEEQDELVISLLRRQRSKIDAANDLAAKNLNALIQSAAGASLDEIDRLIRELESVREMLRSEGERVTRDIDGYASLSHSATTMMKLIADSIKQWKDAPDKVGPRLAS